MILEEIAEKTRERIREKKGKIPLRILEKEVYALDEKKPLSFLTALKKKELGYICEVKKASPSKGLIAPHFPYKDIALEYEQAGADAISVLTEPFYFLGADAYLKEIAQAVKIPVLRKDFIIDPYMIYEARILGASAVLLICSLLSSDELKRDLQLTRDLGLEALVEAHTEREVDMALETGGEIIGVNNRNLTNFRVDAQNSLQLRSLVPPDKVFIAESGIRTREDICRLEEAGVNGVLIGETLMKSPDKKQALAILKGRPI